MEEKTDRIESRSGRSRSWIVLAYAVALAASWLAADFIGPARPLVAMGAAHAAATVVVFVWSFGFKNSSFFDPYWSVIPPLTALWLMLSASAPGAPSVRGIVVIALVTVWGVRLTYNWVRGFPHLGHEDWRYVDLRRSTGRAYWIVSFLGIHFFPAAMVYLGCLSLYPAVAAGTQPLGALDAVAALVTAAAIAIETVADEQLHRFVASRPARGEILRTGLWACSRHPNYFGEVSFWWGLSLFALAAEREAAWVFVGPVAMAALFFFVSIPMLDRRSLARRPGYAEHMKRVSRLVPWFPSRDRPSA